MNYKDSGVDIDSANKFVKYIAEKSKIFQDKNVLSKIGFFNALYEIDLSKYKNPVLAAGTDGIGTKPEIAISLGVYNTLGIDLVAMCVNDLITCGADPAFFLDYYAVESLNEKRDKSIIDGIIEGCMRAECSLIGGETAELPDYLKRSHFELAGFAVGIVEKDEIVNGSKIREGDKLIGLASNGVHCNGFSLVKKIFDIYSINQSVMMIKLLKILLTPTMIYVNIIKKLRNNFSIKGMSNITGEGLIANIRRILPEGLDVEINWNAWKPNHIFGLIDTIGKVPKEEMRRVFNMGIGYVIVIEGNEKLDMSWPIVSMCKLEGYKAYEIGKVVKK